MPVLYLFPLSFSNICLSFILYLLSSALSSVNLVQNTEARFRLWCRDIDKWSQSWAGDEEDIALGFKLVAEFKDYLLFLIVKGRTKKTVKKHADYLWALGGEIISDTNENSIDSNLNGTEILLNYISLSGGPYWRHAFNESEREQFDATCRLLYKYISKENADIYLKRLPVL